MRNIASSGLMYKIYRLTFVLDQIADVNMRSFLVACVAAITVAAIGAIALNAVQEPVSIAFATHSARI